MSVCVRGGGPQFHSDMSMRNIEHTDSDTQCGICQLESLNGGSPVGGRNRDKSLNMSEGKLEI